MQRRIEVVVAERVGVPVAPHLDHVRSDGLLRQAPGAGSSSVMYDATRLPYAGNRAATRTAALGHGLLERMSAGHPDHGCARSAGRRGQPRFTALSTTNFGSLAISRLLPNKRRNCTW